MADGFDEDAEGSGCEAGSEVSLEVGSCCDLDDSSPVLVVWPFELSEGKFGSIAVPVPNAPVGDD